MSTTTKTPPIPLTLPGTDHVVAHACAQCLAVHMLESWALNCCAPYTCETCGALHTRRGWRLCDTCDEKDTRKRWTEKLAKAPKVAAAEWDGPVHVEGHEDRFYATVDQLREEYDDIGRSLPRWVWACSTNSLALDADRIIENETDDFGEYVTDQISVTESTELQTLLDAWCEKVNATWWEEMGTIVVLDPTWLEEGCP